MTDPARRTHPGHWAIENGLHWVRDVTFAEDACKVRTGTGPQVMASLRNLVIGVLSRARPVNLAAASATTLATPPAPVHARHHSPMNQTLRETSGALGETTPLRTRPVATPASPRPAGETPRGW
jgi:hypothetical protein